MNNPISHYLGSLTVGDGSDQPRHCRRDAAERGLKDIYYQFDSVDLTTDAQEILKRNAEWMKGNPKVRVEIEGHCDDVGSAEYNLALGAKRAQVG